MLLYKYRGIQNFRRFIDIILNNRLYAATYFDLNDPMEGQYLYNTPKSCDNKNIRNFLKGEKERINICSLSRNPNNELMWSHYAEGHRGVAIGIKINNEKYTPVPIKYSGLHEVDFYNISNSSATDILSHKLDIWEYEQEIRIFVYEEKYVNIEIEEIICGRKMKRDDINFIKYLVKELGRNIKVVNAPKRPEYLSKSNKKLNY